VVVENVTPQVAAAEHLATSSGALVVGVVAGGPAAKAGLRAGEVVVTFDGAPVADVTDLVGDVAARSPGDVVTVGVLRSGQRSTIPVTLGPAAG
jgi:serine protease Do